MPTSPPEPHSAIWKRAALVLMAVLILTAGQASAAQITSESSSPTPAASPIVVLESQEDDELAPDSDVVLRVGFVAAVVLGLGGLAILDRKPTHADHEDDHDQST